MLLLEKLKTKPNPSKHSCLITGKSRKNWSHTFQ